MMEETPRPTFGSLLKLYRERAVSRRSGRLLSQSSLAWELYDRTGLYFTRGLVSNWETGRTSLNSQKDRVVLLAIISILHENGGLHDSDEADRLMEAGDYRALDRVEKQQLFPQETAGVHAQPEPAPPARRRSFLQSNQDELFHAVLDELGPRFEAAVEGPAPVWPREVVILINWLTEDWTAQSWGRLVLWGWAWVFSYWFVLPSLLWPFATSQAAWLALLAFAAAGLLIPLLVGVLTDTRHDEYWQSRDLANSLALRLYVHQGAGVGFVVGYFLVLGIELVLYNLGIRAGRWVDALQVLLVLVPLVVASMGARLVPYNLWHAYGRLDLRDGGLFFVFPFTCILWAFFFYNYYPLLLDPRFGLLLIFASFTLFVLSQVRRRRHAR